MVETNGWNQPLDKWLPRFSLGLGQQLIYGVVVVLRGGRKDHGSMCLEGKGPLFVFLCFVGVCVCLK